MTKPRETPMRRRSRSTTAPGHLCIYQAVAANVNSQGFEDPITGDTGSTAQPFGVSVYGRSAAAGNVTTSGSWAVTAP